MILSKDVINVKEAWEKIINQLDNNKKEFHTVPKTNKKPVWFSVYKKGDSIFVGQAELNQPSSKISTPRKLTYENFKDVYPLYIRRANGESVSAEVTQATRNQVYYFALIEHIVYEK